MSFESLEKSQNSGIPAELFLFTYGTEVNSYIAYTDAEHPIEFEGIKYVPETISRGNFMASGSLDKSTMIIKTPRNSSLAGIFSVYPPGQTVSAIIRQGHLNDPDGEYIVIWVGRILSSSRDGAEMVFNCEPVNTSLKRTGLRRNYQLGCPHALYGSSCGAIKASATSVVPIVSLTASRITFAPNWNTYNDKKYIGGLVTWSGKDGLERRTILRTENETILVLSGPTIGLSEKDNVSVSLGCNHQLTDCENLHNNVQNYGGQPWIPTKNPIKTNPFST